MPGPNLPFASTQIIPTQLHHAVIDYSSASCPPAITNKEYIEQFKEKYERSNASRLNPCIIVERRPHYTHRNKMQGHDNASNLHTFDKNAAAVDNEVQVDALDPMLLKKIVTCSSSSNDDNNLDKVKVIHDIPIAECEVERKRQEFKNGLPITIRWNVECATNSAHSPHWIPATTLESFSASEQSEMKERSVLSNSENSISGHVTKIHSDVSEMSSTRSSSQTHVFSVNHEPLSPNNAISAVTDKKKNNAVTNNNNLNTVAQSEVCDKTKETFLVEINESEQKQKKNVQDALKRSKHDGTDRLCRKEQAVTAKDIENLLHTEQEYVSHISSTNNERKTLCHTHLLSEQKKDKKHFITLAIPSLAHDCINMRQRQVSQPVHSTPQTACTQEMGTQDKNILRINNRSNETNLELQQQEEQHLQWYNVQAVNKQEQDQQHEPEHEQFQISLNRYLPEEEKQVQLEESESCYQKSEQEHIECEKLINSLAESTSSSEGMNAQWDCVGKRMASSITDNTYNKKNLSNSASICGYGNSSYHNAQRKNGNLTVNSYCTGSKCNINNNSNNNNNSFSFLDKSIVNLSRKSWPPHSSNAKYVSSTSRHTDLHTPGPEKSEYMLKEQQHEKEQPLKESCIQHENEELSSQECNCPFEHYEKEEEESEKLKEEEQEHQQRRYYCSNSNQFLEKLEETPPDLEEEPQQILLSEVPLLVRTNCSGLYSNTTNSSTLYTSNSSSSGNNVKITNSTSISSISNSNTNMHNDLKQPRMLDMVPQNVPLPLHDDTPSQSVFSFTPEESEEQRQLVFEKSLHTPLERHGEHVEVELEVKEIKPISYKTEEPPKEVDVEHEFKLTRLKDNPRTSSSTSTNNQTSLMDRHNSVFSEFASVLTPLTNDSLLPRSHFSVKTEPHYTIGTMRNDELFSWTQKSAPFVNTSMGTSFIENAHLELSNAKRVIHLHSESLQTEREQQTTAESRDNDNDNDNDGIFTEIIIPTIAGCSNLAGNKEELHSTCNNKFTYSTVALEIKLDQKEKEVSNDNFVVESGVAANDDNSVNKDDKSNKENDVPTESNTPIVNKWNVELVQNNANVLVESKSPELTVEVLKECQESIKLQSHKKSQEYEPENNVKVEHKVEEPSQKLTDNNNSNTSKISDGSEAKVIGINPSPQEFWEAMSLPSPINNEGDDYDEVMSTNRKFSTYEDLGVDKYSTVNEDQSGDGSDVERNTHVSTTPEKSKEDARLVCEHNKEVLLCEEAKANEVDDDVIHGNNTDNNNDNNKGSDVVVINDICIDGDSANRRSMNESNLANHLHLNSSIHKLITDEELQEEREIVAELQENSQITSFEETFAECKLPTNFKRHRGHVLRIVFSFCHGILSLIGIIGIILTYLYTDRYRHWFFILNCDNTIDVHPASAYLCNGLMELPAIMFIVSFWLVYLYRRCPQRQTNMHRRRLQEVTERLIGRHPRRRRTLGQSVYSMSWNEKMSLINKIREKIKIAKDKLVNRLNKVTKNSALEEQNNEHARHVGNSNVINNTHIIHHKGPMSEANNNNTTFLTRLEESERREQPIIEAEEVYFSTSNEIKDNPLHQLTAMKSEQIKDNVNNNNNIIRDNCNKVLVKPYFLTVEDEMQMPVKKNCERETHIINNNSDNKGKSIRTTTIKTKNTTKVFNSLAPVSLSTESTNTIASSSGASLLTNVSRGLEQREQNMFSRITRINDKNVKCRKPHEELQPILPQRQWREEREEELKCKDANHDNGVSIEEQDVKLCESDHYVTIPVVMSSQVPQYNNNSNNAEITPSIFDRNVYSSRKVSNENYDKENVISGNMPVNSNNNNDDEQSRSPPPSPPPLQRVSQSTPKSKLTKKTSFFTCVLEWLEKTHCGRSVCKYLRFLYFTIVLIIVVAVIILAFNLFMTYSLMESHRALWITNTTINDYDFCRDVQVFGRCSGWMSPCTVNFTSQEDAHNHNCPYCPWWQETIETYTTTCYTRYIYLRKFNMIFFGAIVLLGGSCMLIILLGQSITFCLNY